MSCITCWQDMFKTCLDSESQAFLWHYQLQTKWMGEDRLSELLGYRWRGSYLQRDRNTVWVDAGCFYENGVFQIILHVRRAKESRAVKMDIKNGRGTGWMAEMWTMLLRNISWVLMLRWCGGLECFTGCISTVPFTPSQWIPGPRQAIWTLSVSAVVRWPAGGLLAGAFCRPLLLNSWTFLVGPYLLQQESADNNEAKFADRLTSREQTMRQW